MENNIDNSYYLKQLEQGSQKAFDILYIHYYPILKKFLNSFLKDEERAKDLSQDIFMKVWINKETISNVTNFSGYLFISAKNALFNIYKHDLIKEKYISSHQNLPNYSDFFEDNLFTNELNELIKLAITQMPQKRREIFTCFPHFFI